jgi:hypothetical protein
LQCLPRLGFFDVVCDIFGRLEGEDFNDVALMREEYVSIEIVLLLLDEAARLV